MIPEISVPQLVAMGMMRKHAEMKPGRQLKEELGDYGYIKNGQAFYQMMARLEERCLVDGMYHERVVDGFVIRQRHYMLTPEGIKVYDNLTEIIGSFSGAL